MANTYLPSTPADGNSLVLILPAVADLKAPTVAEVTAAGAVDISCYLTSDGFNPSLDEQVVSDERLCDKETREAPGRKQRGLEVTYIDNTNNPVADINAAKETLLESSDHVILYRRGLPYEDAVAAGQTVSLYRIKAGAYNDLPGEANSVFKTTQKLFVGESAIGVQVSA